MKFRFLLLASLLAALPVSTRAQSTRLSNVSMRTTAGGTDVLITGFTIGPGSNKQVIVRAVGPTLGAFGVGGTMPDPKLELFNRTGARIAENDNFSAVDAPAFSAVGAFALNAGARDAALVATLAPGSYTAQITGLGSQPTGVVLVEIYEVAGGATRLINLSTRAQVGTGANILIPGITVSAGAGTRRLLLRAVGPTLGAFGVSGTIADPKLELYSGSTKIAENDNWSTPTTSTAADASTLAAAFSANGAFALTPNSKDAALLTNLGPGSYTLQVSGVANTTGVALVEVYDLTPTTPLPAITTQPASLSLIASATGALSVSATGATAYQWQRNGTNLPGATAAILALANVQSSDAGNYTVVLTNAEGSVTSSAATLLVQANQTGSRPNASLYLAYLRPPSSATGSFASGYASLRINADGSATLNVSLSNLSSALTSAHLQLGATGSNYVLNLPLGQVPDATWRFQPAGNFTTNDLVAALNAGEIVVALDTTRFPAGEVRAGFSPATGSQTFAAPATPPALPAGLLATPSDIEAARLLTQATFGPTDESIADVKRLGVDGWIRAQLALPATSFRGIIRDELALYPTPEKDQLGNPQTLLTNLNKNPAWFTLAVLSPDQLRQRTAFALSEIFAVTDPNGTPLPEEINFFYDNLVSRAFGNFRDLLDFVSLNPVMAWNLTFMRNRKADPARGTSPDENYARELQQLYTVGLVQLQPDGTLLLDREGNPIPTYNNDTITETAKVFTGWAYQNENDNFFDYPGKFTARELEPESAFVFRPLKNYSAYRDTTEKRVISLEQKSPREATPTIIRAGLPASEDLRILLDALFRHPNTGPFLCRQLIQRLVTSNPSPAYVYRVAQVFANNGSGVRGDLGAVVRAILLDYEARSPEAASNRGYGKIKEPLLRATALFRLMKTRAPRGGFWDSFWGDPRADKYHPFSPWMFGIQGTLAQSALQTPSVFNFFTPNFTSPGVLASSGLVAPEMQITDASFAILVPNFLSSQIYKAPPLLEGAPTPSPFLVNNFSGLLALSASPELLVDRLNLLTAAGQMRPSIRGIIQQAVAAVPPIPPVANHPGAPEVAVVTTVVPLTAPKTAAFDPAGPFTLEAWVLPFSTTQYGFIMGKNAGGFSALFHLALISGRFTVAASNGTPGTARSAASPPQDVIPGTWTHVAGVFDGSTLRLYVNGVQRAQTTGVPTPPAAPNTPFTIGQALSATSYEALSSSFEGAISQPRFWSVARTAQQISAGMREGKPADLTGLVGGWLLNEGSGVTAADYSGRNHHLRPNSTFIEWAAMNGTNIERVRVGLHLAAVSTDAAFQK